MSTLEHVLKRLEKLEGQERARGEREEAEACARVGDVVQIHADSGDAYAGLLGVVEEVRAGRLWVSILAPHRGGARFPYYPRSCVRVGAMQTRRHRWMDSRRFEEWKRRFS